MHGEFCLGWITDFFGIIEFGNTPGDQCFPISPPQVWNTKPCVSRSEGLGFPRESYMPVNSSGFLEPVHLIVTILYIVFI